MSPWRRPRRVTTTTSPFKIITQTINVGAVMGTRRLANGATETVVAGVESGSLYATTEHAADPDADLLGTGTTDSTGVATFHFPRAMDLGPGGTGNDRLVFAKVTSTGHADLVVLRQRRHRDRVRGHRPREPRAHGGAPSSTTSANFQWWVKSDEDAKDGNDFLEGWAADERNEDRFCPVWPPTLGGSRSTWPIAGAEDDFTVAR